MTSNHRVLFFLDRAWRADVREGLHEIGLTRLAYPDVVCSVFFCSACAALPLTVLYFVCTILL